MKHIALMAILVASLLTAGCAPPDAVSTSGSSPSADAAPAPSLEFTNKVWKVSDSRQVGPGDLRIFLGDGTLVMASDNSRPALGSWEKQADQLTIIEDGIRYPTEILELGADRFRIRMHGPGEPVEIGFMLVSATAPEPAFHFTGTVRHVELEGGLYLIEAGDGVRYQPIELSEPFRKDGLRVEVAAVRRNDMASVGMAGTLIEIRQIREAGRAADAAP